MYEESIPILLLALANPSETLLLRHIKGRVSRLMLEEISENDCGEEASAHLMGIERQLITTEEPPELAWCPREVLELERWQEPSTDSVFGIAGLERQHLKRLLACTILLRSAGHRFPAVRLSLEDFFLETSAVSLVQMVRSVLALDRSFRIPTLTFLLWLYNKQPYPRLRPFTAFSALVLTASMDDVGESDKAAICEWVDVVETRSRVAAGPDVKSDRWLTGLNTYEDRPADRARWLGVAELVFRSAAKTQEVSEAPLITSSFQRLSHTS